MHGHGTRREGRRPKPEVARSLSAVMRNTTDYIHTYTTWKLLIAAKINASPSKSLSLSQDTTTENHQYGTGFLALSLSLLIERRDSTANAHTPSHRPASCYYPSASTLPLDVLNCAQCAYPVTRSSVCTHLLHRFGPSTAVSDRPQYRCTVHPD